MRQYNPSPTNAINAEMNQMRRAGVRVYNFGSGDPLVPNHPAALQEAAEAIAEKLSPYSPVGGLPALREAAAGWMRRRWGASYGIEHTLATCGGKFAIFAALQVLLEPEEEVLFAAPYWVSYPDMIRLAGGIPKPITVDEANQWKLSPQELKRSLTKKSGVFLFNNGCNPTGALYSKEEVSALLSIAAEAGLRVISDEVYSELVYDGAQFASCALFPEHQERCVIVESCSKNFAMAGWRVGFAFAPQPILESMIAVQSQTTTGTSHISQRAALGALKHAEEASSIVRRAMDQRRTLFFQTFNEIFHTAIPPVPSGIYFFARTGGDSVKICEEILRQAHTVLVPGIAFGMEGYVRFAFSEREEDLVLGLQALKKSAFRYAAHG